MANAFYFTNAAAQSMLTAFETAADAGSAAVINIYNGTPPADADTSLSGNTLLSQLTCSSVMGAISDNNPGAKLTFNTVASDTSADASGTASFFRILTQNAGTVVAQGTVGTATADLVLNTTAISAGSAVSISSATIILPEG